SIALGEFGKDIEAKTNGRVKVDFFPGGTLTPPNQTFDSLIKGVVDIGETSFAITPGRFPVMEILDLPTGSASSAVMTRLANEFYKKFKPKELDGVKVLFLTAPSPQYFHTKKAIRKLEDLKGVKIRCAGGAVVNVVKALGAVPVVMPASDVYDAISKGVVNGLINPWAAVGQFKFYEVADYTTVNRKTSVSAVGFIAMNKTKWESLPADIQKIIEQLGNEYAGKMAAIWDEKDAESIKIAADHKHQTINLDSAEEDRWAQQVAPLYDAYIKEKGAKGFPAAEEVAWIRDWIKKNQK
ncbi:MAG TPA: TRAP transporter substrate-binding protein, partial [Syntrophorhabdaceae bacterium]|nr:TRAP transporter substrate-binding protein [Syntrophorhabdaceae bacterium]